jgi:transposase
LTSAYASAVSTVEDWAEIRRLHRAEGMPIKATARVMNVSRNTVRSAPVGEVPPTDRRRPAGSAVEAAEPQIRELGGRIRDGSLAEHGGLRSSVPGCRRQMADGSP